MNNSHSSIFAPNSIYFVKIPMSLGVLLRIRKTNRSQNPVLSTRFISLTLVQENAV